MHDARRRSNLIFGTALLFTTICWAAPAFAETAKAGTGVTFELPAGLTPQTGRPAPIAQSWTNAMGTLSLEVIKTPHPDGGPAAAAKEFQDWPGVGRSMVAGFGSASVRALEKTYNAKCKYEGAPLARDLTRAMIRVRVEVSCALSPEPFVIRSQVFSLLTKTENVLLRIDTQPISYAEADLLADGIWKTLVVQVSERVSLPQEPATPPTESSQVEGVRPVRGGSGIHFTDYGLRNGASIFGEAIGSLFAALAFGALLSMLFIRVGLRPIPSLAISEGLLILLQCWGAERDGVWEINWLIWFPAAAMAVLVLRGWAQRRWEKKHRTVST